MSAVECGICFEDYAEARRPRMLPCGHTFCEVCLGDMAKDQKVQCPKCQQPSDVPSAGYAINYDLLSSAAESGRAGPPSASPALRVPSASSRSETKSNEKCAECQEKVATLFCHNSCGELCDDCSAVVHRLRINRDHVVVHIADKPKTKRMCPKHKDQEVQLYCMQCRHLACYECGFDSHRNHGTVKVAEAAAEKKALVRSRFEFAQPRIAKLNTRLVKIGEEQKLTEHERLSIAAAIDASADQLHEAVTARQMQLRQHLAQITAAKTKNLDLMQARGSSSLAALVHLDQDVKSLQGQDDLAVLDAYRGLLSAVRQGEQFDESSIAPSRLVSELDVSMLIEAIGQWGSVSDLLPVQGVVFDQGSVSWSSLAGAVEYEVQVARVGAVGERKGDVDVDVKDDAYRRVYQGINARCQVSFWDLGEFAVRVRARFEKHGWGPFSSPVTAAYMEWSADQKTRMITLISDARGFKCVARLDGIGHCHYYQSVLSSRPLTPFSSSPSPRVASFQVRVDRVNGGMSIGVCRQLPPEGRFVGYSNEGVGYDASGRISNGGKRASTGDGSRYGAGDVIGVEVDFGAHAVSFFKNGTREGEPVILSKRDRNQPLYAAVTLYNHGDQITLL